MLTSFGITTIEGASTSASPDFFHPTDDPLPFDTVKYQKATGALTWISTRGRPDITMAVNFLSSFNQSPTAGHSLKVLRIFIYLHYTTELGLTYYTIEGPILHCSTDVSSYILGTTTHNHNIIHHDTFSIHVSIHFAIHSIIAS